MKIALLAIASLALATPALAAPKNTGTGPAADKGRTCSSIGSNGQELSPGAYLQLLRDHPWFIMLNGGARPTPADLARIERENGAGGADSDNVGGLLDVFCD